MMQERTECHPIRRMRLPTPRPSCHAAEMGQIVNASWTAARGRYVSARKASRLEAGPDRDGSADSSGPYSVPERHACTFPPRSPS